MYLFAFQGILSRGGRDSGRGRVLVAEKKVSVQDYSGEERPETQPLFRNEVRSHALQGFLGYGSKWMDEGFVERTTTLIARLDAWIVTLE